MPQPSTTTELLLQQLVDSNQEIVDLLRQERGTATGAPSPAPDATSQRRRPAKTSTRGRKGTEVRGD